METMAPHMLQLKAVLSGSKKLICNKFVSVADPSSVTLSSFIRLEVSARSDLKIKYDDSQISKLFTRKGKEDVDISGLLLHSLQDIIKIIGTDEKYIDVTISCTSSFTPPNAKKTAYSKVMDAQTSESNFIEAPVSLEDVKAFQQGYFSASNKETYLKSGYVTVIPKKPEYDTQLDCVIISIMRDAKVKYHTAREADDLWKAIRGTREAVKFILDHKKVFLNRQVSGFSTPMMTAVQNAIRTKVKTNTKSNGNESTWLRKEVLIEFLKKTKDLKEKKWPDRWTAIIDKETKEQRAELLMKELNNLESIANNYLQHLYDMDYHSKLMREKSSGTKLLLQNTEFQIIKSTP